VQLVQDKLVQQALSVRLAQMELTAQQEQRAQQALVKLERLVLQD
jgi:hypothetical protein